MYIENDEFGEWMQKLYAKLEELCKDVRVLRNADKVLPEDDNLLDNQDLCLLFKVSIKTLQRYRAIGVLPYFTISGKVYYRSIDTIILLGWVQIIDAVLFNLVQDMKKCILFFLWYTF